MNVSPELEAAIWQRKQEDEAALAAQEKSSQDAFSVGFSHEEFRPQS